MTSRQRAYLRGLANNLDAIIQIGKQGVTPEISAGIDEALEARELVKVALLQNCDENVREAAEFLAQNAKADCVQVIGRKFTLYRRSRTKPAIELPR